MLAFFWLVLLAGLIVLAFAAGISLRVRMWEHVRPRAPVVDDQAAETILSMGTLSVEEDEPLDIEEIDDEERRFWSESWDEPEEV